jgi:hypothetical protein
VVDQTTFLVFGDMAKSHQDELVRRLNHNYFGDTKYHFYQKGDVKKSNIYLYKELGMFGWL